MAKLRLHIILAIACLGLLLPGCMKTTADIDIDNYEFVSFKSAYGYNLPPSANPKEILRKVSQSQRINGQMKGAAVNLFTFVNRNNNDTLDVCIYKDGDESTHFSLKEDWCRKNISGYPTDNNFQHAFFESKEPLLPN